MVLGHCSFNSANGPLIPSHPLRKLSFTAYPGVGREAEQPTGREPVMTAVKASGGASNNSLTI